MDRCWWITEVPVEVVAAVVGGECWSQLVDREYSACSTAYTICVRLSIMALISKGLCPILKLMEQKILLFDWWCTCCLPYIETDGTENSSVWLMMCLPLDVMVLLCLFGQTQVIFFVLSWQEIILGKCLTGHIFVVVFCFLSLAW